MKSKNIKLEIKTWGSVLDWRVTLEKNNVIGHWASDSKKGIYFKNLPDYSIEGKFLEVNMIAKGKNGAKTTLTIKIDGQDDQKLECVIKNGRTENSTSIPIKGKK